MAVVRLAFYDNCDDNDVTATLVGGAQLLLKQVPWPLNEFIFVPRGPAVKNNYKSRVLTALGNYTHRHYPGVTLTIEPHWFSFPRTPGWQPTSNTILIPNTLILDLTKGQDALLADISGKRRYDIRKSSREVTNIHEVTNETELEACLKLYRETAKKDHFALHDTSYYRDIFHKMGEGSCLLAAWQQDTVLAFIWLAVTPYVAFELFGGINQQGQRLRANYALKWYCITTMQQRGVKNYDFNGLLNDGISNFKRSFSNHVDRLVGSYDRPLSPLYDVWRYGLPGVKKVVQTYRAITKKN